MVVVGGLDVVPASTSQSHGPILLEEPLTYQTLVAEEINAAPAAGASMWVGIAIAAFLAAAGGAGVSLRLLKARRTHSFGSVRSTDVDDDTAVVEPTAEKRAKPKGKGKKKKLELGI